MTGIMSYRAASVVTPIDLAAPAPDVWPPDELEAVECCPTCGSGQRNLLHQNLVDNIFLCSPGTWQLYRCSGCAGAYLNPRPTSASIGRAYKSYYTHDDVGEEPPLAGWRSRIKRALKNGYLNVRYGYTFTPASFLGPWASLFMMPARCKADRSARHLPFKPSGRLLDIGCGNGAFVRDACAWGWNAEGMDPDPDASVAGRKAGVRITAGSLPKTDFPDASFDAVTMSHSIEHLHDPVASLKEARRILKPGGVIWIATPNLDSAGHQIFGAHWRGLEPPRHLMLFTPKSLALALTQAGFDHIRMVRSAFNAQWFFTISCRLAKGEKAMGDAGSPLPFGLKVKAMLADWRAFFWPRYGEEIVFMATRPAEKKFTSPVL